MTELSPTASLAGPADVARRTQTDVAFFLTAGLLPGTAAAPATVVTPAPAPARRRTGGGAGEAPGAAWRSTLFAADVSTEASVPSARKCSCRAPLALSMKGGGGMGAGKTAASARAEAAAVATIHVSERARGPGGATALQSIILRQLQR